MLKPIIKRRPKNRELYQSALHSNASSFQADIISKRQLPEGIDLKEFLNPDLSKVDASKLKDISKAASRIIKAISMGEIIGLVCDFDVDGVSSGTILYESLVNVFGCNPTRIKVYNSYRMEHGYGLTPQLIERIQTTNPPPTLIITADQGSKDGAQVTAHKKWAKSKGIISDIIITDHHEIDEDNLPKDAYAFINPKRSDCEFECKDICGAVVALMLMAHVRKRLIDKGVRDKSTLPPMGVTLPLAAAATIADCTSIAYPINRGFVHAGVKRMNAGTDICWAAFKDMQLQKNEPITSQTIGFKLAPIINAASRMGKDALLGVKFFLSETDNEAKRHLIGLKEFNEDRKIAQRSLFNAADIVALQQVEREDRLGLCIYQPNGNHGIHGIVAASVAQKYGRPTIILAPKSNKKTKVKFDIIEKENLNVDIFSKLATFNEVKVNKDEVIEIKKTLDKNNPTFTLYSTFSGEKKLVKELTMAQATSMTTKSLFKGLGKREHVFSSKMGNLILDLSVQNKPKLYLEGVDELTGSARSVHGVSIKNIFERIEKERPDVVVKCGGHEAAGGVTIKLDNLDEFRETFDEFVRKECADNNISLQACYYSDGELPEDRNLDLNIVDELNQLEPFGIGFERPAYEFDLLITKLDRIGESEHYKIRGKWDRNGTEYNAFWPRLGDKVDELSKVHVGSKLRLLCEVGDNYFRSRTVQLTVVTIVEDCSIQQ